MRIHRKGISTTLAAAAVIVIVAASVGAFAYYDYLVGTPKSPLIVYSADLYATESSYLYRGFANSTGIPYAAPKAGGSTALATQIAQGNPVSVFISVSKTALGQAALGSQYPGWGIAFASDQMVIGYAGTSGQPTGFQQVLNDYQTASATNSSSDWRSFFTDLTSGMVRVGISNPNTDPAGFRGWLVLQAAGFEYAGNSTYFVDRLLQARANVTESSAADLVAPLESGNIQFLFMYKSAAIADQINPMVLPSRVNLGDPSLGSFYSQFSYTTSGGVQSGGPILLFITVPRNSSESAKALDFVVYVVNHASSMSQFGMVPLGPAKLYNSTDVPGQIAQLLSQGSVVGSGSI